MRQDTGQMSEVTLVNSKDSLRSNRLRQTVKHALVQVTGLVVHSGHNCI